MSELVEAFRVAHTTGDLGRARIALQRIGTPREVLTVAEAGGALPAAERRWVERLADYCLAGRTEVQRFERTVTDATWTHFRGSRPERETELVIGLAGGAGNLFHPTPVVLQQLDADRHDLLLLRDPDRSSFLSGAGGHPTLAALVAALRTLSGGYASLLVIGTSMGGGPAVLLGPELGARRCISLGGNLPDVSTTGAIRGVLADDWREPRDRSADVISERWAVHGADCARDREGARRLQSEIPDLRLFPIAGVASHNVSHVCFQQGTLTELYSLLLGPSHGDAGRAAPATVGEAAPLDLARTFEPPSWADPTVAPPVWLSNASRIPNRLRRAIVRIALPPVLAGRIERFAYRRFGISVFFRRRRRARVRGRGAHTDA